MKIILDKLRPLGFNDRQLTEADFYAICESENIEIIWSERKYSFYFSVLDQRCIVLPKKLKGLRLLFAEFHELAHALLSPGHAPEALFNGLAHSRDEMEADAVALVALMPRGRLRELAWLDGSRYGSHLFNERLRLMLLYDI